MKKIIETLMDYVKSMSMENQNSGENYIKLKYIEKIEFSDTNKISMDTNDIEKGDIFFAIRKGNDYIEVALEKGASFVICDREQKDKRAQVLCIEDTVKAMQEIGNLYRKKCEFKIVGITGSNGKTSTKDILYSILKERFSVVRTRGNLNTQIGVPYTILNTPESTDYIVLEMGMSDFGHIASLCKIAEPDYGIITNIGLSHMEYLKTQENVFKAKGEMLQYVKKEQMFLNCDDEFLKDIQGNKVGFNNTILETANCKNYIISDFCNMESGSSFLLNNIKYESNLYGVYNSANISLGIAVASQIGITHDEIQRGLRNIEMTPMRFEKIKWNGLDVINDAYNSSPISLKLALETFSDVFKNRKKIAVIGDMLELGEKEEFYHIDVLKEALNLGYDKLFLYGDRMKKARTSRELANINSEKIQAFDNKDEIIKSLISLKNENPVIILKGSRGIRLEEILK